MDFSLQSIKAPPLRSSVVPALLGTIATALVSLVFYRLHPDAGTAALLYLFVVVVVSLHGSLVASLWVILLAVLALDYFFTPPTLRLWPITEPLDVVALIAFLTTALVINRLIFRMRQSLKEVEVAHEQLQRVIDTVPTLLTSARPDGAIEFVNQQWSDFLGLSREEFRRGGWATTLHPDDRDGFVAEWRAALASGVPLETEARMRRGDGEYRWLLFRAVPLRGEEGRIVRWYGTSTDIEDRKRAEEKVRQADRERGTVIDTIPALVWSSLPDGSSDFNNERWLEYTGLSGEEARDWGYKYVIHPEDYQRLADQWGSHFATGEPIEDEARLRRADGQYRWFLHRALPLRDEQGTIVKWYGTSTDIEDLKRAEDVLRDHAQLLDLSHDTVFVRAMSDVITYWNHGAEMLYGWSRYEAVGKVSHQLTQTIFPASLDQINEELLRTGRWEGELVHTKRDGTRVVVASRWSLQRDDLGRPAAILETNNDVTLRKRAEDALRRSEAYLSEAQRMSHTGSTSRLITGEAYWSEETYRIFGVDPGSPAPSPQQFLQICHPDDRHLLSQAWEAATRATESIELDFRIIRPDGAIRHVHGKSQPVLDNAGAVAEVIGVVMDVTDQKRAQRALRRAREYTMEARFAAVLEERTRLARDIHDTLLQGFTGIALKLVAATGRVTAPPESVAALRDLIGLAQQTLIDARRAVWDLRAPSLEGADVSAALQNAAEDCVRGTELRLAYEVGGSARPVDQELQEVMVRVLQEAITNAVKHAMARSVRVRLSFKGRGVRLTIIDDGRGFVLDPDLRSYGGHWGLLGMRERATQVRGKLSIRSTPGHGTEVVLLVPYASGRRAALVQTASSTPS
ncbi:MAG: hypothetical protein QOH59_763 [Gemmatimonadales bacterium]|nr:hypothetical protein [Gemmatimonadales bacterium]